jgi:hypothetical protein
MIEGFDRVISKREYLRSKQGEEETWFEFLLG